MNRIQHYFRSLAVLGALLLSQNLHAQMPGTPYMVSCQDLSPTRDGSSAANAGRSCLTILTAFPSSTDGVYWIDPDGNCGTAYAPMQAQCDMTTDGGGWTLVFNYLHKGGTNPALVVMNTSFPQLGSSTLGTDESGTQYWGHITAAMLNVLPFTTLRFYGLHSVVSGSLHFKTSLASAISYVKTDVGSFSGIQSSYTALSGHTTGLPGTANFFSSGGGANSSLYYGPFHYMAGPATTSYSVYPYGSLPEWEMEKNCDCTTYNTLHRTWVR